MTELSLIVLRANDLDKTRQFYTLLGLEFVQEQHGSGPIHFSSQCGSGVIEIYPGSAGTAPDRKTSGATTLGFRVVSFDTVLQAVEQFGAKILTKLKDSQWGRRAVVEDPDGRAVKLNEVTP